NFEHSNEDCLNGVADQIFENYVATVGYSSLSSVQECLQYQNQITRQSGQSIPLTDLLFERNTLAPAVAMKAPRGFRV
ncbi:MAG: hypothetical protein QF886_12105, partial [Planctomycetota bacterium]|nr:hypothetical protein [Planctomycetota bacterium]